MPSVLAILIENLFSGNATKYSMLFLHVFGQYRSQNNLRPDSVHFFHAE